MRALILASTVPLAVCALTAACGESRRPIGEECVRNEDCLSDVCAARSCVSAPTLVTGASGRPDEEEPLIPTSDAASDARTDG